MLENQGFDEVGGEHECQHDGQLQEELAHITECADGVVNKESEHGLTVDCVVVFVVQERLHLCRIEQRFAELAGQAGGECFDEILVKLRDIFNVSTINKRDFGLVAE